MIIDHLNHAHLPSMMDITWYRVRTGPLCLHPLTIHIGSHVTPSGLEEITFFSLAVFCIDMCLVVRPNAILGVIWYVQGMVALSINSGDEASPLARGLQSMKEECSREQILSELRPCLSFPCRI